MGSRVEQWTDSTAERVLEGLAARRAPIVPKAIVIREVTDGLDDDAWRLVLVLPAPEGETWDREHVFTTRRIAIELFDSIAASEGTDLPGSTVAFVTTDEADVSDTAEVDSPEPGEDPGRDQ